MNYSLKVLQRYIADKIRNGLQIEAVKTDNQEKVNFFLNHILIVHTANLQNLPEKMNLEVHQINHDERPTILDEKFLNNGEVEDLIQNLKSFESEVKNWRQIHSRNYKFYKDHLTAVMYLSDPD